MKCILFAVAGIVFIAIAFTRWVAPTAEQSSPTATVALTAVSTSSARDPFDLPTGVVAIEISWDGLIRSAVQRTAEGPEPAELEAVGDVSVNGAWRDGGSGIDWDDLVELGAIKNAGLHTATITFESGLIIDLEPDAALFINNELNKSDLHAGLIEVANCTCTCTCQVPAHCGQQQFSWSCSDTGFMCSEFNGDGCTVGNCSNTFRNCRRHWTW